MSVSFFIYKKVEKDGMKMTKNCACINANCLCDKLAEISTNQSNGLEAE